MFVKINHRIDHNSRFYSISESVKKQLFSGGGLPKEYQSLSETLNGLCIMVRKPTIELIHYLNKTNFDAPVLRYVLCKLLKLFSMATNSIISFKIRETVTFYLYYRWKDWSWKITLSSSYYSLW